MARRRTLLVDNNAEGYLTFTAITNGTFRFTGSGLYYSTNGFTWTELAANTSTPTISAGRKIHFKGTINPSSAGIGTFSSTNDFSISGNPMSLLYGDDFIGKTSLSGKNSAFRELFKGCTRLADASQIILSATTLSERCYNDMFRGCSYLATPPATLTATTLANNCCDGMFRDCTRMTTAPTLPATTLSNNCYRHMFNGTGLTAPPVLPATTLAPLCYTYMFANCHSLTIPPTLNVTTLVSTCYQYMFQNCTSLTSAPELPATTLTDYCYGHMFDGCTRLTTAPELPAATLANHCYEYMFQNCTSLNYIKALFTTTPSTSYTNSWVNGVASTGTFVKCIDATWSVTGVHGVPTGWVIDYDCNEHYLTFKSLESLTFIFTEIGLSFSLDDGNTWETLTGSRSISVPANSKILWKGNMTPSSSTGIGTFSSTGQFKAEGNVMSLLYGDNFTRQTSLSGKTNAFFELFSGCSGLTDASHLSLPATKLADYCYGNMFNGCTSLTTAPELPATTLDEYCYTYMFQDCTSLTSAPELSATTLADSCYSGMFCGCTSLTTAPELPATTLVDYCYEAMFLGCTSLSSAPELPATTLVGSCYLSMFDGCTSLTTAPELPATTLADSCYSGMFYGCTSLTSAPELPATTLVGSCYGSMFDGCTSLTTAPELPATTLADSCYSGMFEGCTRLTSAPELPATTLVNHCYEYMFRNCTSLTSAPELPATTLSERCYQYMFSGCTSLNYIKALFTTTPSTTYTDNWVNGVASTGTFVKCIDATWSVTGVHGVPTGWVIDYDSNEHYLTFKSFESGTFSFSGSGISYSLDNGTTWVSLASGGSTPTISANAKILWKGNMTPGSSGIGTFSSTGRFKAEGNVMSLLYGDNFTGQKSLSGKNNAFINLFKGCGRLTDASYLSLPATTLSQYCYRYMFQNCTSLTSAPELPATTLANRCYQYMFNGCTSLTSAPELPATKLADYCYGAMFQGCTGLTSAPELPATTSKTYCYAGMFQDCTGLTSAPELPATTMTSYCYVNMFNGCTSLTSAPELPATTLAEVCYGYMFSGCTSLATAPELPATTLANRCYVNMFNGCTSLNYIKALFTTTPSTSYTDNWVNGVAPTGTFVKSRNATWNVTGVHGVPTGWAVYNQDEVNYLTFETFESLTFTFNEIGLSFSLDDGNTWETLTGSRSISVPANSKILWKGEMTPSSTGIGTFSSTGQFKAEGNVMSLLYGDNFTGQTSLEGKYSAFKSLFNGCGVLTDASHLSLPATTLASSCYESMFQSCTSLAAAPKMPATTLTQYCYRNTFKGCTSLTAAPELPTTTLHEACYYGMFEGCSSLVTAPSLPATSFSYEACYYGMFKDCTSLTTAPELPATSLTSGCYIEMFNGCSSLNYIKALFTTTPGPEYTGGWVNGVASTGTFVKSTSATWDVTGVNGVPTGWTVERV